jgi:hypothetical protein
MQAHEGTMQVQGSRHAHSGSGLAPGWPYDQAPMHHAERPMQGSTMQPEEAMGAMQSPGAHPQL